MEEPLCILVFISPDFLSLDFQTSFILISDSDFQIFAFWFPYFKLQPSCNMWQAMEERFNLCLDFHICRKGVPKNVTWRFGFASLLSSLILMLHALSGSALQIWSTRSTWGYIFVYYLLRLWHIHLHKVLITSWISVWKYSFASWSWLKPIWVRTRLKSILRFQFFVLRVKDFFN